jgi:hypothetical protein
VRFTLLMFMGLVVGGCAVHRAPAMHSTAAPAEDARLASVTSAALVFDPPVTAGQPLPDLSRVGREPSAFVSYDEVFTSFFYLRYHDRQIIAPDGTSDRRAITETFGVTRR